MYDDIIDVIDRIYDMMIDLGKKWITHEKITCTLYQGNENYDYLGIIMTFRDKLEILKKVDHNAPYCLHIRFMHYLDDKPHDDAIEMYVETLSPFSDAKTGWVCVTGEKTDESGAFKFSPKTLKRIKNELLCFLNYHKLKTI